MSRFSDLIVKQGADFAWSLDELSGQFNSYTGSLSLTGSTAPPTRGASGVVGTGIEMARQSGQYIHASTDRISFDATQPFSWSAIALLRTSSPGNNGLLCKRDSNGVNPVFGAYHSATLTIDIGAPTRRWQTTWSAEDNLFHLITVTHIPGGIVNLYIDGEFHSTHTHGEAVSSASATSTFAIGTLPGSISNNWGGIIDEVAVWERKLLSPNEIRRQYVTAFTSESRYATVINNQGADHLWSLNEQAGPIKDSISGLTLQAQGTGMTYATASPVTNGIGFSGESSFYSSADTTLVTIDANQGFSFSCFIRRVSASPNANRFIFGKRTVYNSNSVWGLWINTAGSLQMYRGSTTASWSTLWQPPLNTWSHIAVTYEPSVGTKLYVNGALQASSTEAWITGMATSSVGIGGLGGADVNTFSGGLDEVAVWSRKTLSQNEVAAQYKIAYANRYLKLVADQGATHLWELDEQSGTFLVDSIGSLPLTSVNSPTLGANGVVGTGISFTNSAQHHAFAASSPSLAFDSTKNFSYSWMMYFRGNPNANFSILSRRVGVGVDRTFAAFTSTTGNGQLAFDLGANQERWYTGWIPSANTWYHIAYTYEASTRTMVLYVDGAPVRTANTYVPTSQSVDAPFYLGLLGGATDSGFTGTLDEVAIFKDKLLSAVEVATQYNTAFPIMRVFNGSTWNDADRRII